MKQSGSEAHTPVRIGGSDQKFQRVAEILVLEIEPLEPLGMTGQIFPALLRQHKVVSSMGATSCELFATLGEAFQSVLPNGREHQETRLCARILYLLRQTLVHHRSHTIKHVQAEVAFRVADGFHSFKRTTSNEHRQSSKQALLRWIQQAVTPIHGAPKSLLPQWQIACASCQQIQRRFQAQPQSRGGEQLDSRCGKL